MLEAEREKDGPPGPFLFVVDTWLISGSRRGQDTIRQTTMGKNLRVIPINFPFQSPEVVQERTLSTDRALFDFDVVVIRPPTFGGSPIQNLSVFQMLDATMNSKKGELQRLFAQGGVLVVLLDLYRQQL